MALSTTTNSGSQNTASDSGLQSTVAANGVSGGTPSAIQPGTSSSMLLSNGGIPLTPNALSVVTIGQTSSQTATAAKPQPQKINPVMLTLPGILLIVAIGLFLFIRSAEKNTTI